MDTAELEQLATTWHSVSAPATEAEIEELLDYLRGCGVENPVVPPFLKRIWERGASWARIEDSYGCYGLNFVEPEHGVTRDEIFGDEELRREWQEQHGVNSTAARE
jgi:hypothetical protein